MVEQRSPKPLVAGSNPATPAKGIGDNVFRAGSNYRGHSGPPHQAGGNQRLALGIRLADYSDIARPEFPPGTAPHEGMAPALVAPGRRYKTIRVCRSGGTW